MKNNWKDTQARVDARKRIDEIETILWHLGFIWDPSEGIIFKENHELSPKINIFCSCCLFGGVLLFNRYGWIAYPILFLGFPALINNLGLLVKRYVLFSYAPKFLEYRLEIEKHRKVLFGEFSSYRMNWVEFEKTLMRELALRVFKNEKFSFNLDTESEELSFELDPESLETTTWPHPLPEDYIRTFISVSFKRRFSKKELGPKIIFQIELRRQTSLFDYNNEYTLVRSWDKKDLDKYLSRFVKTIEELPQTIPEDKKTG